MVAGAFNRSTAKTFVVWIAKVAGNTLTDGRVIEHLAGRVTATNDILARVLAVIEASIVRLTGQAVVAFIVIVAAIFNSRNAKPLQAGIVRRTVAIGLADLQTFSIFAFFILITVAMGDATAAAVVVHKAEIR